MQLQPSVYSNKKICLHYEYGQNHVTIKSFRNKTLVIQKKFQNLNSSEKKNTYIHSVCMAYIHTYIRTHTCTPRTSRETTRHVHAHVCMYACVYLRLYQGGPEPRLYQGGPEPRLYQGGLEPRGIRGAAVLMR